MRLTQREAQNPSSKGTRRGRRGRRGVKREGRGGRVSMQTEDQRTRSVRTSRRHAQEQKSEGTGALSGHYIRGNEKGGFIYN